jgi:hypothetical protein
LHRDLFSLHCLHFKFTFFEEIQKIFIFHFFSFFSTDNKTLLPKKSASNPRVECISTLFVVVAKTQSNNLNSQLQMNWNSFLPLPISLSLSHTHTHRYTNIFCIKQKTEDMTIETKKRKTILFYVSSFYIRYLTLCVMSLEQLCVLQLYFLHIK